MFKKSMILVTLFIASNATFARDDRGCDHQTPTWQTIKDKSYNFFIKNWTGPALTFVGLIGVNIAKTDPGKKLFNFLAVSGMLAIIWRQLELQDPTLPQPYDFNS